MFKSLNTDWLKLALLRVFQSGWTVVILVGLSLLFCSFTGRQAFIIWWLTFAGVLLIGRAYGSAICLTVCCSRVILLAGGQVCCPG
jgi:pheromone shutdown protein TraB